MGTRAALVTGTAVSLAVTAAWSWSAVFTIGPASPPRFGRSLPGDYASLAAAPTGNGLALFAVTAVIYAACLLAFGLRARARARREAPADVERAEEAALALTSGRRP